MYAFLTEHLGSRQDNIIDMRDAKKPDLERLFGAVPGSDGELARLVRSQPDAKVVVYYSGHGATDSEQSDMYLLPVDTQPYRDEIAGYRLSTLYANLAKLGAKSVLLLLETEFGRDHSPYLLPPNVPETVNSALPSSPLPGLTVLLAADRGQRRLIDPTYDIGLFTRYLIEGMAGSADRRRWATAMARSIAPRSLSIPARWWRGRAQDLRIVAESGLFERRIERAPECRAQAREAN